MRAVPLRLAVVVGAVIALALIVFVVSALLTPMRVSLSQVLALGVAGGALFLARRHPLPVGLNQHLMVGTVPLSAATLLLPVTPVLATITLVVLVAEGSRRAGWLQASFNTATAILQVAAGAGVWALFTAGQPFATLSDGMVGPAAFLTSLTMYATGTLLVECVVAVQHRHFSLHEYLMRRRLDLPSDGALYTVGVLVALLATDYPWAVLLLAVPTLLIYRSLRDSLDLQQQLTHRATHDELTDLGNRSLFTDRARQALARAARTHSSLAVLFLDIDGFKRINDTLGHGVGDDVLKVVAQRLQGSVRPEDTVARLGGDEFIFLLEDHDAEAAAVVATRLLTELRTPVAVAGRELLIDASVGIVPSSSGHDTVEDLLRSADIAMYRAKAQGKGRFEVFAPAMALAVQDRVELEAALRQAVDQDKFLVQYQPTIDLSSGRVTGSEALVRWQHPEHGLIPPGRFIPLAEEPGLLVPIGRWVLREACAQARRWHMARPGLPPLSVSVNLSVRQLQEPNLVAEVADILAQTGLQRGQLVLEVTESAMMGDPEAALQTLQALKSLGVRLALDDFGTGYSSLSYLHRFPFDILKVDKAFVDPLTLASRHDSLVRTIVEMARSLKLRTVAEGIETVKQAEAVRLLGCDSGQGYYFARPLSVQAMDEYLDQEASSSWWQHSHQGLRPAS